jgi:catalase
MFMWAMSDRGIPRSYRMMQGFGVNTYRLVNKEGVSHFVKFHFTPTLGVHSLMWDEALKICGQDPDFHRKDLWEAIESGAFPTWKFGIQVISESRQDDFEFDILDATKIWPEELVPVRYIGELQLNRNPDEFFTQTEQSAFCTAHVVPGIDFSDDPLLQGRNFSYFDTQLSRLGVNWQELPINRPICPVMNNNRDGAMRHRITKGTVNYWPNRFEVTQPAKPSQGGFVSYPEKVNGMKQRLRSKKFQEHINQAQLFYNSLSDHEKAHLTNALAFELDHCDDKTVYMRIIDRLTSIDLSLAQAVAVQLGAPAPQKATKPNPGHKSAYLSQTAFAPKEPTIATRRIAIIICDGYNASTFTTVRKTLRDRGALTFVISTRRAAVHPAEASDSSADSSVTPDHHAEGMRSTLFDALLIPDGAHISSLRKNGRVIHWIIEAFGHCKAIGAIGEAITLVKEACGVPGVRFAEKGGKEDVVNSYGVVTAEKLEEGKGFVDIFCGEVAKHRCWEREAEGLTGMVAY